MPYLLIRHTVTDYEGWRSVFDEHVGTRRANGSGRERVLRDTVDPNAVVVLCEWDDLDRAHFFIRSDDLHEAMARAEMADRPDIWLLNEATQPAG